MLPLLRDATEFELVQRNQRRTIAFVPGWASDWRVFNTLNYPCNYLLPMSFHLFSFEQALLSQIEQQQLKKITLFGWSMGGFLAASFAGRYPQLVDHLILVGVRRQYTQGKINEIKEHLRVNKRGFLYRFYRDCFSRQEHFSWFKECLLRPYCDGFKLDYLTQTLQYLAQATIDTSALAAVDKITFIHGTEDVVAPLAEAKLLSEQIPHASFMAIYGAGHLPFLNYDLGMYI